MANQKNGICTKVLIIINVAYFLILSLGGMTEDGFYMLEHGAAFAPYIIEYKEYYRLFTSMFLHFGVTHLMNNMITLGVVGLNVEPVVGKVRFLIIYLVSGLCGNISSLVYDMKTQDYAISAGASGAIFGLTGALLALTIIGRGRVGNVTRQGMLFMVLFSLYLGFTEEGVDNFAHIGGLLAGMLITFLLAPRKKSWKEEGIQ